MTTLPPSQTPLNQHSLGALECWLDRLGAKKNLQNPSLWNWDSSKWTAEITLGREDLCVSWKSGTSHSQRCFSYGLSREDVEAAINEGL